MPLPWSEAQGLTGPNLTGLDEASCSSSKRLLKNLGVRTMPTMWVSGLLWVPFCFLGDLGAPTSLLARGQSNGLAGHPGWCGLSYVAPHGALGPQFLISKAGGIA